MRPPKGYPTRGTVTSSRVPVVITCQVPGCGADVTVIALHTVESDGQRIDSFVHQLCDQHAAENEDAMRSTYTVKPPATIWR